MNGLRSSIGLVALVASAVLFAQNDDTKPPDPSAVVASQVPTPTGTDPCAPRSGSQAEILTDTKGVDFGPYMTQVVKTVRQNWYDVIPPSAYPPIKKEGKISIEFVVHKDGKVDKMKIATNSGDEELDRAAWASINASNPLPPLPLEFSGEYLGLRLYYYYNLKPDTKSIYITPCIDVRVPAGSTVQFSVPLGGIERAAVTWSVFGPACNNEPCGTISESGLYTAPAAVPRPPTVFVKATPLSKRSSPAQIQLTVVKKQARPAH